MLRIRLTPGCQQHTASTKGARSANQRLRTFLIIRARFDGLGAEPHHVLWRRPDVYLTFVPFVEGEAV